MVTDRRVARAEARSHDSSFLRTIAEAYRSAFSTAAEQRPSAEGRKGSVKIQVTEAYDAYRLVDDEPVIQAALGAVRAVGLTPKLHVADGGSDANWLVRHGVPTVSLGCGAHRAHTVEEYISVDEFLDTCRIALELARSR